MWIYLMENKSEVFTQFKKFKLLNDKDSEYGIKKVKTDVHCEYTSIAFT